MLLSADSAMIAAGSVDAGTAIIRFAGYEGILCGASAAYLAIAEVLNEVYGRPVLAVGLVKK